jgi:opacity protein-like surface antigen
MKKASIMGLALVLVLAASAFASAANYVGGGLGIKAAADASDAKGIIGALSLDFDVMEKLTLSANGYIEFKQKVEEEPPATDAALTMPKFEEPTYFGGVYGKYALTSFDALKLGAVAGVNFNNGFIVPKEDVESGADEPAVEPSKVDYGAGIFAEQPLGETGTIYGQAMYWMQEKGVGGLGGINFKLTDKIAVKGQIEYVKKQPLFSIGVGYTF